MPGGQPCAALRLTDVCSGRSGRVRTIRPVPLPERPTGEISRRRLLAAGAASVLGAVFLPGVVACSTNGTSRDHADEFWATVASAARADDPSLTTESAIAELGPQLGSLDRADIEEPNPSMLKAFTERSADDFANGRTVMVVGWLLSRTEVLLATVAAKAMQ